MTAVTTFPHTSWDLVTRAKSGDREAFAEIYRHYHPMIAGWIYYRTGDTQLTRDLTGDVFLRALTRIDTITWQGKDIGAWLHTIARNRLTDYHRRAARRGEWASGGPIVDSTDGWYQIEQIGTDRPDDTPRTDPADAVAAYLVGKDVLAAVTALRPEYREVIVLRYLNGLSLDETAQILGKTKSAIKNQQHRALQELRQSEIVAALAVAA